MKVEGFFSAFELTDDAVALIYRTTPVFLDIASIHLGNRILR